MRQHLRHHRWHVEEDLDETVGLAGWMYTDLLLGLAVVFLGTIAFLVPALTSDSDAEGVPATTTIESTTTTTMPVELCPTVYVSTSGEQDARQGLWIQVRNYLTGEDLREEFLSGLQVQIDEENALLPADEQLPNADSITLALVLGNGHYGQGESVNDGYAYASNTLGRLKAVLPALFEATVMRPAGSNLAPSGYVGIEVYPIVVRPCLGG